MCPVGTQSIWTIWKSSTRLADGREIVYFDEEPGLGRDQIADTRPLPPRMPGPQPPQGRPDWGIRRDRLAGEWVVIAADNYDVVVFENRFPSLAEPLGRCEVVCFTPNHDSSFAALSPRRVRTVLEAWIDRTQALGALPETRQVYCFENRGEEIGVTLHHPHGQIYAFPFVGPKLAQMVTQAREYAATSDGANLFDDMVAAEVAAGTRVVTRNEHWVVFGPGGARWPYEVRIFPVVRVPDLPALDEEARESFGPLYLDVLRRFDALFGQPAPYIAAWHQAPVRDADARGRFAAHLQVLSVRRAANKLKYLAGTESGMGVWINDIVPEEAALRLREA